MRAFLFPFFILCLVACENPYFPKPRGYYRIDFPEKEYQQYDNGCPFVFDYPVYATVEVDPDRGARSCWLDVVYPGFNARLHLSYFPVTDREILAALIEDARKFAYSHAVKASGIQQSRIDQPDVHIYGVWYEIQGNVASGLQFFLTDSTHHYLRGALYFNENPRRDSIQPVMDFLEKDLQALIRTTRWK